MSGAPTLSRRGGGAIVTVAALSAMFGALLVQTIADVAAALQALGQGDAGIFQVMLTSIAMLFFGIAIYVGGIVTANSVSTVIAGRTREIALLRLLGASGSSLRRGIVRSGLVQGVLGGLIGLVAAVALTAGGVELLLHVYSLPRFDYPVVSAGLLFPVVTVVASTVIASWTGSRCVLTVTPSQAVGSSAEPRYDELRNRRSRNVFAVIFVCGGFGLLALAVLVGMITPFGLVIALCGGMASFSGVVLGASSVLPPLTALIGRAFGRGQVARLATANAIRHPVRSARAVIGLAIGVTLVTMFAVGIATVFGALNPLASGIDESHDVLVEQVISVSTAIASVLLGFSVVLAAVGMVNTLSLSVMQRRRELGLLRSLGFTGSQVRALVILEAAQMIITATLIGLVLGVLYGWSGAVSLLGSLPGVGVVPPTIPVPILVSVLLVATVITVVSAVLPARRATRVSPVEALAVS
ncbi:ABC transporter permease [Rathayibacter toxicus]|uniref:ABC transporter permease n=1 Tax=Rathayibacter toxicus TaxID=145458 RepID=UPI001C0587C2|nr:FtsX-like permease family protein [Rathayibacter toxicus]QWL29406.1 FtsX-like permease family protein [Rathayibacter toxicus]